MTSKALAEWSDDDIRTKLLALGESLVPITPTTRQFLLRKIEKSLAKEDTSVRNQGTSHLYTEIGTASGYPGTNGGAPTSSEVGSEQPLHETVPVEGYYTIVPRQGVPHMEDGKEAEVQSCPLYTSRADALRAVKNTPGARFKKFESKDAAVAFWESQKQLTGHEATDSSEDPASSKSSVPGEKANNYPSLKTPDLNKFRKLIESGNLQHFVDAVWSNPRYLITSGDTPEILQQGCRYNALHCAVRSGKLIICKELLSIIEGERFWELVYPDDSVAVRQRRRDHLVDLYLNMQDKVVRLAFHLNMHIRILYVLCTPQTTHTHKKSGTRVNFATCRIVKPHCISHANWVMRTLLLSSRVSPVPAK